MADNVAVTAGTGTNIATDDVGGIHYQRVKMVWGADGTANDTSASSPLPVGGAAADDAAAAGNPLPIGGVFQSTVDEIDDGDIGRLRVSSRRGLVTVPDSAFVDLYNARPANGDEFLVSLNKSIPMAMLFVYNTLDVNVTVSAGMYGSYSAASIFSGTVLAGSAKAFCSLAGGAGADEGLLNVPALRYLGQSEFGALYIDPASAPASGSLLVKALYAGD